MEMLIIFIGVGLSLVGFIIDNELSINKGHTESTIISACMICGPVLIMMGGLSLFLSK